LDFLIPAAVDAKALGDEVGMRTEWRVEDVKLGI
jgi:hypothetical protein